MDTELTHDQILDLLPAYALGALEPEEMLAVDDYLHHNPTLLDRLRQLELAAAQMAFAAPNAPLPAAAKNQLLARVQADSAQGTLSSTSPAAVTTRPARRNPEPTADWWASLRQGLGSARLWAAATACAVIALIILGVNFGQVRNQLQALQAEVSQLQTAKTELEAANTLLQQQLLENETQLQQASGELDSLQNQTAELQAANSQLQETNEALQQQTQNNQALLALISDTNLKRVVPLPGTADAPAASGVFYLTADDQGVLVLRGLEPLSAEQTYQLWLIPAEGPPAPAGLLAVQAEETTWLELQVPPDASADFAAVGVSVEPAGGSLAPTGPIVLLGEVG